jgi:hypothetical protein
VWCADRGPVSPSFIAEGTYQLDVGGRRLAADVGLKAPYDPGNGRIRS